MIPVPIHILGIDTIQTIDHVIYHTIKIETTQVTEIEVIQIRNPNYNNIGIPTITIEEIILNPLIETTIVTPITNTNIEVTHQNISDKLTRYKHLKKQLQIPLVLTTPKIPNYN